MNEFVRRVEERMNLFGYINMSINTVFQYISN